MNSSRYGLFYPRYLPRGLGHYFRPKIDITKKSVKIKGLKKGGKYDFLPRAYYLLPLNNKSDIKMAKNADIGIIY